MRRILLLLPIIGVALPAGCGGTDSSRSSSIATSPPATRYGECVNLNPAQLSQKKSDYQAKIAEDSAWLEQVELFIRPTATQSNIDALGEQIRSMSEVKSVTFVSKEEALQELRRSFQGHEDALGPLPGNPLPASFILTVYDPDQIETVARRFFDNPFVDNTPGTHDGVKYYDESGRQHIYEAIDIMKDFNDNARSCDLASQ